MASEEEVHLYWATGCTSCLKVKEFLERNDVPFVSHNVISGADSAGPVESSPLGIRGADQEVLDEMVELGLPDHVPVVRRGDSWADGKDLAAVADLVSVDHDAEPLPVQELRDRLYLLLDTTQRYLQYVPEDELETTIPNRPRSYADLIQHIFTLPDVFIMHEAGVPMDGVPRMEHEWDHLSTVALSTYGATVQGRLRDWFDGPGLTCEWEEVADVFWGQPTKHEFLERTTWHTGQHVRQLEWILVEKLDVALSDPLNPSVFDGLPLPEKVWNEG